MARNPKDVIVSYFHHHKLLTLHKFTADIEKFADYFMKDECKNVLALEINRDLPYVMLIFIITSVIQTVIKK